MKKAFKIILIVAIVVIFGTLAFVIAGVFVIQDKAEIAGKIVEYTNEIDLHLKTDQKLYYHVSHIVNEEQYKDSVLHSYFIFNKKKYNTPKKFRNDKDNYQYSLFPKFKSGGYNYVKTFEIKGKFYVFLQSVNPFCNGTSCNSYFLHLLIIKNGLILNNYVYFYNSEIDVPLYNIEIRSSKNIEMFCGDKLLDTLD